ncbi:MAG: hypothetical protein S4CHLAM102_14360 [Chlamydiia bacterium]|nr:hypothetical protein [Chlamydiia bacterium]
MVHPEEFYDTVVWDRPVTRINTGYVEDIRPGPHYQGVGYGARGFRDGEIGVVDHYLAAIRHLNEARRLLEGLYGSAINSAVTIDVGVDHWQPFHNPAGYRWPRDQFSYLDKIAIL